MNRKDRNRYEDMKRNIQRGDVGEFAGEAPTAAPVAMPVDLGGRRVAVIVADGFEQAEFDGPVRALRDAGATVEVLAEDEKHLEHIVGVRHLQPSAGTHGDRLIDQVTPDDYDALVVPGGAVSPDHMRQSPAHLALVAAMLDAGKPVAMICHGPWLLADANRAEGRTLTTWPGIRRDLERAGATWKNEPVVEDGNLITSRKPGDVPAFSEALIRQLKTADVRR